MSKKVLIKLAAVIADIDDLFDRERMAQAIGEFCLEENPRFDWAIWHKACDV